MAKVILPFPPVRPMDPVYVQNVLEGKNVDQTITDGIISALNAYNEKCNIAVNELEEDLNKVLQMSGNTSK